jgi:uncharacterized protein YdeI (YjbR/CyaY-like superfamily)
MDRFQRVEITSRDDLHRWLLENHTQTESVWLVVYKKHVPEKHVNHWDIVDEGLCFGWIDSRVAKLDEDRSLLLFSPRKPKSAWSRVNKERLERLFSENRMQPTGLKAIEIAKENGSWERIDEVTTDKPPQDFLDALSASEVAKENWSSFPPSSRRAILEWILMAKKPETRANRIRETVEKAAEGVRVR